MVALPLFPLDQNHGSVFFFPNCSSRVTMSWLLFSLIKSRTFRVHGGAAFFCSLNLAATSIFSVQMSSKESDVLFAPGFFRNVYENFTMCPGFFFSFKTTVSSLDCFLIKRANIAAIFGLLSPLKSDLSLPMSVFRSFVPSQFFAKIQDRQGDVFLHLSLFLDQYLDFCLYLNVVLDLVCVWSACCPSQNN